MGFSDIFRPKWKHSVPGVRLDAVKKLRDYNSDILKTVARSDTDDHVRMAAIAKISDRDLLEQIARDDHSDDQVKKACVDRFSRLYGTDLKENLCLMIGAIQNEDILAAIAFESEDATIRKNIIDRVQDQRTVWKIASDMDDPSVKCLAVSKISDEALLAEIAEQNCGVKAGKIIVEALSSPTYLSQVAEKASSRKIRKMAEIKRDRLFKKEEKPVVPEETKTNIEENDLKRKNREDAINAIETILRELSGGKEMAGDALPGLLERAQEKWTCVNLSALAAAERIHFMEHYKSAIQVIESCLKTYLSEKKRKEAQSARLQTLINRLDQLLNEDNLESLVASRDEIAGEWARLGADDDGPESLMDKFNMLLKQIQEKIADHQQNMDQALKDQNDQKAALLKLLETVESACESERFFEAEQIVKSAKAEWQKTGERVPGYKEELTPRIEKAFSRFFDKLFEHRENRSWEQWANLNIKKELCATVEALFDQNNLSGLATQVRDAFNAWKETGSVHRDESDAIWERFRAACDKIYEICLARKKDILNEVNTIVSEDDTGESSEKVKKLQEEWNDIGMLPVSLEQDLKEDFRKSCDDYFNRIRALYEKRETERQENLEIKKALLDRAESLLNEPHSGKVVEEIIDLQKKWKQTGPIPKSYGDAMWEKFRGTCNQFFERIGREHAYNLKEKEHICEQAEELIGQIDAGVADDQIRSGLIGLQQKWKDIGPVPKESSDQIWERFRKSCDAFFDKYHEEANRQYAAKEALVVQAEKLKDSDDWKDATEQLKMLQQEWKNAGVFQTPKDRDLWQRFHHACDYFFTRKREKFREKEADKLDCIQKKESFLTKTELLARIINPDLEFEHLKSVPMNEQLSLSLVYRDEVLVPENNKSTYRNVLKQVGAIRSEWLKLGNASGNTDRELWKKFVLAEKEIQSVKL
ncbi:MAG: DUF349 domain-containing protein [Proteobacteria bacterium]|nr:DUF349 domain-containing protein [Pseudomonadota bacterium]